MSKRLVDANEIISFPECSLALQDKINAMPDVYTDEELDGEFVTHVYGEEVNTMSLYYIPVMLRGGAYMPRRAHIADAGADLRAPERFVLRRGESMTIDTGVCMQISRGFFGRIESKSGLGIKHGITAFGGIIDSGYTGSIVVRLENHGVEDYTFESGDKICQIVILPCVLADFYLTDSLEDSERGENGFGSTGK